MPKETDAHSSRKRGASSTLTSYHDDLQENSNSDNVAGSSSKKEENYKSKYESIYHESKKIKSELDKMKQREIQLEEYSALLETKNETLAKEIKQLKIQTLATNSSTSSSSIEKNEKKLETDLENIRKIVSFYELMTCMKVEYHPSVASAVSASKSQTKSDEYTCTIKNKLKRIATRFVLRTPTPNTSSNQNLDFLPKANVMYLPEYLRAHVNFEATNAPVMMGDILLSLFNEEGTDEAD